MKSFTPFQKITAFLLLNLVLTVSSRAQDFLDIGGIRFLRLQVKGGNGGDSSNVYVATSKVTQRQWATVMNDDFNSFIKKKFRDFEIGSIALNEEFKPELTAIGLSYLDVLDFCRKFQLENRSELTKKNLSAVPIVSQVWEAMCGLPEVDSDNGRVSLDANLGEWCSDRTDPDQPDDELAERLVVGGLDGKVQKGSLQTGAASVAVGFRFMLIHTE